MSRESASLRKQWHTCKTAATRRNMTRSCSLVYQDRSISPSCNVCKHCSLFQSLFQWCNTLKISGGLKLFFALVHGILINTKYLSRWNPTTRTSPPFPIWGMGYFWHSTQTEITVFGFAYIFCSIATIPCAVSCLSCFLFLAPNSLRAGTLTPADEDLHSVWQNWNV